MALCGQPGGRPALPPAGLTARLDALCDSISAITAEGGHAVRVAWGPALAGRAALLGLGRRGRISSNGSCRLLRTADGWLAVNLPRPADLELVPALTGMMSSDPWGDVARVAALAPTAELAARARLLGLAAAPLPPRALAGDGPARAAVRGVAERHRGGRLRVVDLSALWAGPVAARVLAESGATVTKVESLWRLDSARAIPDFYRWVHPPGEESVAADLRTAAGRERLARLLDGADVVIEASRPRALQQLGLGPDDRAAPPGQVWLSITGHGRSDPGRDWVAFGDDAAVAGGLVCCDEAGDPVFCADAVADPLTGLVGALAVLRSLDAGGGQLIDLAMSRVAAAMAGGGDGEAGDICRAVRPEAAFAEPDGRGGWQLVSGASVQPVRDRPDDLTWIR